MSQNTANIFIVCVVIAAISGADSRGQREKCPATRGKTGQWRRQESEVGGAALRGSVEKLKNRT